MSTAIPIESNPGPMLAEVPGTLTTTFWRLNGSCLELLLGEVSTVGLC